MKYATYTYRSLLIYSPYRNFNHSSCGVFMDVTVLIVDDEELVRQTVSELLSEAGFKIAQAKDADEAILIAQQASPNLILADVKLKGMDGFVFCRQLKADQRTAAIPIILLSGTMVDTEDQINGLANGADDYLLKPVEGKLLVARIQAVLRRYTTPVEQAEWLKAEDLILDVKAWTVTVKGKAVYLTHKEFDLLLKFIRRRGHVLHPSFLLESVWGQAKDADDFRTVRVHISSLRKKLGEYGNKIINIQGVGYKFDI